MGTVPVRPGGTAHVRTTLEVYEHDREVYMLNTEANHAAVI